MQYQFLGSTVRDGMEQKGFGCIYGSRIGIHEYTLFGDEVQLIQSVLKNPGIRLEDLRRCPESSGCPGVPTGHA